MWNWCKKNMVHPTKIGNNVEGFTVLTTKLTNQ